MVWRRLRNIYRRPVPAEALPRRLKIILDGREYIYRRVDLEDEKLKLRYGSNPHQPAAIYVPENLPRNFSNIKILKYAKGGLSSTNLEDGYRAMRIVSYFKDVSAVAIMKHLNPSGVAISLFGDESPAEIFEKAWNCDPRAAYGCTVGFNVEVDGEVAEEIVKSGKYVECIFAPSYSNSALKKFNEKKSLRLVQSPLIDLPTINETPPSHFPYEIRVFGDILLFEKPFYTKIKCLEDLEKLSEQGLGVVTERKPTRDEMIDLLHAWWICCEKRSNGIVLWRRDRTLAIGLGQQDRIGAIEVALYRARLFGHSLEGSVAASDGFMLEDNVKPLAEAGVKAIIQPGGSVFDAKIIKKCDEYDIAMIFTGERVFRHF